MEYKSQLDFAQETRSIENAFAALDKDFLAFVADNIRTDKELSTAEKYTLLTAFIEDITGSIRVTSGPLFDNAATNETASKLVKVYNGLMTEYGYEEKQNELRERQYQNSKAWDEWNRANSPKSPLLPN